MSKKQLFILLLSCVIGLQNLTGTEKKNRSANVKDIFISEQTYQKLTSKSYNHRKEAKLANKRLGLKWIPDDPHERVRFENLMLQDPKTGKIPDKIREKELQFLFDRAGLLKSLEKAAQLSWQQRGPYNVGGRTRALAVDKTNENIILAGGVTGGMWRSTNNGQTWVKTSKPEDHPSVTAIAQDPRDGQTHIWYYTTGEFIGTGSEKGAFYSGEGVFKSTDGGQSWNKLSSTDQNQTPLFTEVFDVCWNICVDPTNGDVFVATYGGVYRSTDQGASWSFVLNSNPNNNNSWSPFTDVICTSDGVKYATLSSNGEVKGIFRSETGNSNDWVNITPTNFPTNYRRIVIAYAPSNTNALYFLGETPDGGFQGHSLWKLSWDENNPVWENRSNNLPENGGDEKDVNGYKSQNSYNMVIKTAPDDENMLFIGGINLHRSDDGFATKNNTYWIGGYATANDVSPYKNQHPDQHALVFKSDNSTLVCGHDGGLSITSDFTTTETDGTPVNWTYLNNGYYTTQSYAVAIDEDFNDSDEIITGFQDNGTWYTGEVSATEEWIRIGSGDGSFTSLHNARNSFLVSSQNGTTILLVYDEQEETWNFARVDPLGATDLLFINPYLIDYNNDKVMYFAGGQYVWRNSNIYEIPLFSNDPATVNWEKLEITQVEGQISALETSTSPGNILYYGTSRGEVFKLRNAGSEQPERIEITGSNMPKPTSGGAPYVRSIETDPLDADKILVCFSNYEISSIFYSENGGETWSAVGGTLEENADGSGNGPSVRWVNLVHTPDGVVYLAGTSIGLFSTTTLNGNSTQWVQESPNLIGNTIVNMVKTRKDGLIVAGSHGSGVFSAKVNFSAEAPIADFVASETLVLPGTPISFKDRSIGIVDAWDWTFEGAETTSSTGQNPTNIVYNQEGEYTVSLTTGNSNGTSTKTKTAFITVTDEIVGIDDTQLTENNDLKIIPNPMESYSEISFPNPNRTQYRLIVVDATGRVVKIIENITGNNFLINREQLHPGIHILNLSGEKIYKGKILVK